MLTKALLMAAAIACLAGAAEAQTASSMAGTQTPEADTLQLTLPTVEVIAATPLLGSGVDRAKVPAETTVLTSGDITANGIPDALQALNELAPGVTLNDTASNPYQPTLVYHGFEATPLQGNAQGIAVYVNGARFNQPFGDTVNWDLIPDIAINRMNLEGSNPVFGLNALGGSLAVEMKNGFTYQGGEVDAFGGSFDKYGGEMQYGVQSGNVASYVAGRWVNEGGWRDPQSSDLANFFGDLGWRGNGGELHVDLTAADTRLNGPGTSPIQQIEADPAATFTGPALLTNKYVRLNVTGNYEINDATSLQSDVYYDNLMQKYANGAVADFAPCDDGSGLLCEAPGTPLTDRNGNPIPDYLNGGPYSELSLQSTNTNGYGASLQATNRTPLWGHGNHFVAGLSFDGAQTLYAASAEVGGLDVATSEWFGPGITIDQADGSIAPARVAISNDYYGAFFTDIFDITSALSANVAGRFNLAQINLADQLGTALSGDHTYLRFNPSGGLTYKILPGLSVYASYAEANRAPMPVELTCASPTAPCSLANFLAADPNLNQVVSHTIETGVRSEAHPFADATLASDVALYHTTLSNDIEAVGSSLPGLQYYENVGSTLRQGVDLNLKLTWRRLTAFVAYSYIDAEFQTAFTEQSPSNPAADADGNIFIKPGDRIPGIPENVLKFGADYRLTDRWTLGGNALAASGQYLVGDESNQNPKTPPYFVLNLHASYQVTKNVQLFGEIDNAFNAEYYTYGTFGPTSSVPIAQAPGATNPREYSPAAPIGAFAGVRATF
ncbi:MAG TPA: TonB-dependent receptor [Stellaceae bacterium]|nr:TonB-dependent receptor [Stellaceae bacterium]